MKKHIKILWKVRNHLEMILHRVVGGKGLLSHKEDHRDKNHIYRPEEGGKGMKKLGGRIEEVFSRFKYYFNQHPFNICVFASAVIAFSEQEGIRFSVRWAVKNAKRLGLTSGNGYSYLRAMGKVATDVGFIPYELMPDEPVGALRSWSKYSEWTDADERLLEVAKKYRSHDYRWITSERSLVQAIENGYVPCTGSKWFSEMNNPKGPSFLLRFLGYYIGGHAYRITGWSFFAKYFETPQTFSKSYGDNTKAWVDNPFKTGMTYGVYVLGKLPLDIKTRHFKQYYEGKVVKVEDDPKCYYIENGKKRHITTIEIFWYTINKLKQKPTRSTDIETDTNIGPSTVFDDSVNKEVLDSIPKGHDFLHFNS